MNKNIHVDTGIGYIEKNLGTINVTSNQNEAGFKVRLDFKDVEKEMFQLHKYGEEFSKNNKEFWPHLKNDEDFDCVYTLDDNQKRIFTDIYSEGRDCAISMSDRLLRINEDFRKYRDLTSVINDLESSWIVDIKVLEDNLKKSENSNSSMGNPFYSVNQMNSLYKEQINLLKAILKVVMQLKLSDLYTKENPRKSDKVNISNAPDDIKKTIWLWDFAKKYPKRSSFIVVLFVLYLSKDYIYEQNKHFIHVDILHTEVAEDEKIKLNHIFNAGGQFVSLYDEIKYKNNSEPSIPKNELTIHFSALNFNDNGLLKYSDMELSTRLNEYGLLRSKFEGHIHQKFPQYKSLYDAGLYIILAIQTKDQKYLNKFDKSWKKFQKNCDYETPNFDISNIRSSNDMTIKSLEIFTGIQQWLNK